MAYTANFLTEAAKKNFSANVIVKIGSDYFGQYQPDSGLTIDSDKLGLVDKVSTSAVKLDIRNAKTPLGSLTIDMADGKNGIFEFSAYLGAHPKQLIDEEVIFYFGFRTGSFDFSDYAVIQQGKIDRISKKSNGYSLKVSDNLDKLQVGLLNTNSTLVNDITDSQNTIELVDTSGFPSSGTVKINEEFITYTSINVNTLEGVSRGQLFSTASEHDSASDALLTTQKTDHVMDILLDILLNDLGLTTDEVDTAAFIDIRDNSDLAGEADYNAVIYGIENALQYMEEELCYPATARFIIVNGKISITLLDQAPYFDDTVEELNETSIDGNPSWNLSGTQIVNVIQVKWNFNHGQGKFVSSQTFKDDDSIAIYGERKPLKLEYKAVDSAAIVTDRKNRLLARLSTPRAKVGLTAHLDTLVNEPGDNVRVVHRFLPTQGGALGFSEILEVMSKGISGYDSNAKNKFNLEFSSYTGIRIGLIAPSQNIGTVTDQKTFTVADASQYLVGGRYRLRDTLTNDYTTDPVNEIIDITGNTITMQTDFTTTLVSTLKLAHATYSQSSGDQRAKYAYIAPNTNLFPDSSKGYQILF